MRHKPRKPNKPKLAYFIRRSSHVDDSTWFNDQGRRIFFEKAAWASWLLPNMDSDQKPKVVRAPILKTDISFQDWLPGVLPDTVTVGEYLAAIERTMRDQRTGRGPSRRASRAFLSTMRNARKQAAP